MKFNMTMTTAEIISIADIMNQIMPDSVKLNDIMPDPGKIKVTTIKNQKIVIETFENSDMVACSYEIDPDFMVSVFEMMGGFAGNITGACKALMKHSKLLMQIMGTEEIIQTINGMVVGTDCDSKGNPINKDKEEDIPQTHCGPENNNECENIFGTESPIADMLSSLDFTSNENKGID